MKHRSNLKYASAARARAEDKEKEARRMRRLPKTSCDWPERSCRPSRLTCGPRWRPWSGPAKKLWRRVTLWMPDGGAWQASDGPCKAGGFGQPEGRSDS